MKFSCKTQTVLWMVAVIFMISGMPVRTLSQSSPLPIDIAILEDPLDVLRLVNRDNLLDKDYPDQTIDMYKLENVTLPVTKGSHQLRPVANAALEELFKAAAAEGMELYVGSSYRRYRNQEVIYYNRVKRMGYDDGYSQMAGASEHQMGLAADVVSAEYADLFQTEFGETPEGIWLRENCARFGFIIRYPEDKTDITGVRYEPWHLRYVGPEAAAYIMENDLTLEEFSALRIIALGEYYGDALALEDESEP
ncbi:MAG TPA: M15 family metallopeptidase [Candidatus Ventricola intestinavium]|nr:M15 family metallopeptidase [Candidatus Ventricola intestinavium]